MTPYKTFLQDTPISSLHVRTHGGEYQNRVSLKNIADIVLSHATNEIYSMNSESVIRVLLMMLNCCILHQSDFALRLSDCDMILGIQYHFRCATFMHKANETLCLK